ncbi:putative vacuolar protein sorting protein [Phaeomoniella chlamydospora]|uniref:Putative vacuolar protein sorting protein n=1 Tax=Phaeomoniella chlamydospora TaxID=158046 RepID=A0A0G2GVN3_PHACM|nr:putative vacuolar protein sorting protein [Phaeomoniella chlamydospora]
MPIGSLGKKASLWCIIGTPGIWWIDLQIDGVRKGSLAQHQARLPRPGTVIALNHTSPLDALYIAAIFDPIFTASYPTTRLVERISLMQAIYRAFAQPLVEPPPGTKLVELQTLIDKNHDRVVAVFPECTTTNGRAILPFSPSLLSIGKRTKVFPVSLRYTPADITTPIPGSYGTFLWNLCSKPTHCIRVRIAEAVLNTSLIGVDRATKSSSYKSNFFDTLHDTSSVDTLVGDDSEPSKEEKVFLDRVGEALSRLGRVKRVGLGVKDKVEFVNAWTRSRKRR